MTEEHKKTHRFRGNVTATGDTALSDAPVPALPSNRQLRMYYDRELPQDLLDEYDLNCVRYLPWRLAIIEQALVSLDHAKVLLERYSADATGGHCAD